MSPGDSLRSETATGELTAVGQCRVTPCAPPAQFPRALRLRPESRESTMGRSPAKPKAQGGHQGDVRGQSNRTVNGRTNQLDVFNSFLQALHEDDPSSALGGDWNGIRCLRCIDCHVTLIERYMDEYPLYNCTVIDMPVQYGTVG